MPVLQFYNISHQFGNGEVLFRDLSGSVTKHCTGIVGRNGTGKSILASILSGNVSPSAGTISMPGSTGFYHQQTSCLTGTDINIAHFLGKDAVLEALSEIESGDYSEHLFEIAGENWDLPLQLTEQLCHMGLPADPYLSCSALSGGQLAKLQLWQLFNSDAELLILDEPSNHLDSDATQWLLESMHMFRGSVLLISHNRKLLREMEEIWELSGTGLKVYGGNYDIYKKQKHSEELALERQISGIEHQKKQLEMQAQKNRERTAQRAAQGNKLRRDKSQPKVLMDKKKEKATAHLSKRNKNEQLRRNYLQVKSETLKARKESVKEQKFHIESQQYRTKKVISVQSGVLSFGSPEPINLQIRAHDRIHLTGRNGCGKSTLLKTLSGQCQFHHGEIQVNTSLCYLDQHFALIQPELPALDILLQRCTGMTESKARTLLAGIGFRRDNVFRYGRMLSGGERMKLAMLIISHQPEQPFLLLDEPDNHLDLSSKVILAQALKNYSGGFILVSHDQDFADESGITQEFRLSSP